MTVRVGINGFGRIGRSFWRAVQKNGADIDIVAVNDLGDKKTMAHLLKYDSVMGVLADTISSTDDGIVINGKKLQVFSERDPAKLPWKQLGVDVVVESTGFFTERDKAAAHLSAGARVVVISAPATGADATFVYGVNHTDFNAAKHQVVSNASCTTNCFVPLVKVLDDAFGVINGMMTTVHAYTGDQMLVDGPHKDLRRARAANLSMIPTTTGAAKAVGLVIPELKGKVDGFAIRVPTPDVSVVDFVAELNQDVTVEDLNRALKNASENSLKGILGFSAEPLVSIDYTGDTHSSIVDSLCTMVIGKRLAKVVAWYDNEMGFSARMCDVTDMIAAKL
jgi:glyceraldehyde 3-phosphate dehydrogenase